MKRIFIIALFSTALAFTNQPVAQADVNDFTISNYQIDMHLDKNSEGRSTLKTVETITADFPDFDQNRGLERAIPKSYDGHKVNLSVESVVDEHGQPRVYSTYSDENGNLIVRMADMNNYVHGQQTYKLTYTQRDVTRFFADTNSDEFYWDTNGTGWRVPISRLDVNLTLSDALTSATSGQQACYFGKSGSTDRCDLLINNGAYSASAMNLSPGQNITLAIGFKPETFVPYQQTLADKLIVFWFIAQVIAVPLALISLIWIIVRFYRVTNRTKEVPPIAPEYIPPAGYSVTIAANIRKNSSQSVMSAQMIDLAVRHYIKIYEVSEKTTFRPAEYEIEVTRDPSTLLPEEQEFLSDSFGQLPAVGQRLNLKSLKNNMAYYKRTLDNDANINKLIRGEYGLREKDPKLTKWLRRFAVAILILGLILLSPFFIPPAIIAIVLSFMSWRLTDKGLALVRYLKGLTMYIKVAEQDRLKMLQSPEGASKIQADLSYDQPRQLVRLYERVLPYAILFGQEKEWSKQLGKYYEQSNLQPDWYMGHSTFSAIAFTSGISGISQASNYASSASSSTGGSSGGGSSGGGGGGGGGGGV